MEALIVHNNSNNWSHLKHHGFFNVSHLFTSNVNRSDAILNNISEKDVVPNRISIELMKHCKKKSYSAICLDTHSLGFVNSILLSCHIRFSNIKESFSSYPIIIIVKKLEHLFSNKILTEISSIRDIQFASGFKFIDSDDFYNVVVDIDGSQIYKFEKFIHRSWRGKSFPPSSKTKLVITSEHSGQDRHSIANQWGAIRLARNAGYTESDINYEFPATLYFKYLNAIYDHKTASKEDRKQILEDIYSSDKVSNSVKWTKGPKEDELIDTDGRIDLSPLLKKKKILLIDDNADKGWKETLQLIFKADMTVWESHSDFIKNIHDSDISEYDFLLVDLYLPKRRGDNELNKEITNEVIEYLKKFHPHIPLIVFTASNKSWTLDEVLELGADGMYVKESPEFADDKEYSKENIRLFISVVTEILMKYRILKPYWDVIKNLKQSTLKEKEFRAEGATQQTTFVDRKNERLDMFYGLLKRGSEQRRYNEEMFHFSDYELAFITLWSLLNEISESNYDKEDSGNIFSLSDLSGKKYNCRPIPNHYNSNWRIAGTDYYLIKHEYSFDSFDRNGKPIMLSSNLNIPKLKSNKFTVYIKRDNQSYKLCEDRSQKRLNIIKEIAPQICFVILNSPNITQEQSKQYCKRLYQLNEIRNHLYLTHGEFVKTGFYSKTEKEKRSEEEYKLNPAEDIKDLFEIITHLVTGKQFKVKLAI